MWKRIGIAIIAGSLLLGGCQGRSFGQVGPPITIPPPFGDPSFVLGGVGEIVVSGSASAEGELRPGAKVSVLNLNVGLGTIVVTGDDALYQVTIPGVEGDIVEITVEFGGELFRSEFEVDLTP